MAILATQAWAPAAGPPASEAVPSVGGQEEKRRAGSDRVQASGKLESVSVRQHRAGDDQVRGVLRGLLLGFPEAAGPRDDTHAGDLRLQPGPEGFEKTVVVVDQQHFRGSHHRAAQDAGASPAETREEPDARGKNLACRGSRTLKLP